MIRHAIAAISLLLLMGSAAQALLTEQTPERVLFVGYPASAPDWIVRIVRRKESFGLYAFRTGRDPARMQTQAGFIGLVEGSFRGVGLDTRAAAFLVKWLHAHPSQGKLSAERMGPYYRYHFSDGNWVLGLTLKRTFEPSDAHPFPEAIISQLYGARAQAVQLERLSRAIDVERFQLRDGTDLRRLTP